MTHEPGTQSTRRTIARLVTRRPLFVVGAVLLATFAAACSSTGDARPAGTDARPGDTDAETSSAIYVSTQSGQLISVDPVRKAAGVLWERSDTQLPVFGVGPTANSEGLYVLLGDTAFPVETSLHEVTNGSITPAKTDVGNQAICLDNHQRSSIPLAHQATKPADDGATHFRPVSAGGEAIIDPWVTAERASVFCPRWTSQRDTVLTTVAHDDSAAIETRLLIERSDEQFSIAVAGCLLTPMSISPDDKLVAISALCLESEASLAGLYLLNLSTLDSTTSFSDLRKIAAGNFGNGSWDPTGALFVAARTGDTPDEQATLTIIDVATTEMTELTLPDGSAAHTVAWLPSAIHE